MNYYINYIKKISLLKKYILIGFFLHLISAYFSIGFYKDDEHFQIYEPVAYLLGFNNVLLNDGGYWYWEWDYAMRPWLQPFLYNHLISIFQLIGLNDSFQWSFVIRLISSLIGFSSIIYLFLTLKHIFFKKDNHFNFLIFFTFWFYPYLHSRSSSENLGISIFIISFCFLYQALVSENLKLSYKKIFVFSILLGISMVIRLNLIFTIFPIFIWIIFFKFNFKKILIVCSDVIISLIVGAIIDIIYYGKFTFSYWNYFYWNIVYGRMIEFGEQPWWFYLPTIAIELAPFLSIIFVISLLLFWFKKPFNIMTWLTALTLLIISFFGHKEIRYAFPVYIFAPLFISYFFEIYEKKKFTKLLKILVVVSNFLFLTLTLFTPANGKVAVYSHLNKLNIQNDKLFYIDENPYLINDMEPFFYTHFLPEIAEITKENFLQTRTLNNFWIITNNYNDYKFTLENSHCKKVYNSFPEIIINLNKNWENQRFNWFIINCNNDLR